MVLLLDRNCKSEAPWWRFETVSSPAGTKVSANRKKKEKKLPEMAGFPANCLHKFGYFKFGEVWGTSKYRQRIGRDWFESPRLRRFARLNIWYKAAQDRHQLWGQNPPLREPTTDGRQVTDFWKIASTRRYEKGGELGQLMSVPLLREQLASKRWYNIGAEFGQEPDPPGSALNRVDGVPLGSSLWWIVWSDSKAQRA